MSCGRVFGGFFYWLFVGEYDDRQDPAKKEEIYTAYKNEINAVDKEGQKVVPCSICLELLETRKVHRTNCGHLLHELCLDRWAPSPSPTAERFVTCPVCRKKFDFVKSKKIWDKFLAESEKTPA